MSSEDTPERRIAESQTNKADTVQVQGEEVVTSGPPNGDASETQSGGNVEPEFEPESKPDKKNPYKLFNAICWISGVIYRLICWISGVIYRLSFPFFMLAFLIIGAIGIFTTTSLIKNNYFLISLFVVLALVGLGGLTCYLVCEYREEQNREERKKFEEELNKLSGTVNSTVTGTVNSTGFGTVIGGTGTVTITGNGTGTVNNTDTQQYNYLGHLQLNWSQLRGYYDISKKQANSSFGWAIVCFFVGIAIIASTVVVPVWVAFSNTDGFKNYDLVIAIVGAVSGAITEFFAATIMLVYKKSLEQLNFYHDALAHYQTYLSCVNLAGSMSNGERDKIFKEIINKEFEYAMKSLAVKSKDGKSEKEESKENGSENNKSKEGKPKNDTPKEKEPKKTEDGDSECEDE